MLQPYAVSIPIGLITLYGLICVFTGHGMRDGLSFSSRFTTALAFSIPTFLFLLVVVLISFAGNEPTSATGAAFALTVLPILFGFSMLGGYVGFLVILRHLEISIHRI